jgi:hypothetical protein
MRRPDAPWPEAQCLPNETAQYFGLRVEVIARMTSCSLIRYGGRESVVETKDLQSCLPLGRAA